MEKSRYKTGGLPAKQGLYDPSFEHDACGVGFVVHMKGHKSHDLVKQGLQILVNLDHRGACGCEANTGDGAGMLMQMPHEFMVKAADQAGFELPAYGQYGAGLIFLPKDPKQWGVLISTGPDYQNHLADQS